MSHLDDETVALRALGEDVGPEAEAHLVGCDRCRAELSAFERVTASAREGAAVGIERPGAAVWERIAAELALPDVERTAIDARAVERGPVASSVDGTTTPGPGSSGPRWWRSTSVWVAAASFAVGVLGTVVVLNLADRDDGAPVVASAVLDPLPGRDVTGTAAVREVDGRRVLDVSLGTAAPTGFLEVWLLDADGERLVSLGVLDGTTGTFVLPAGLDTVQYPLVDVSDEPYDGDPAHSGDSVVRGRLA